MKSFLVVVVTFCWCQIAGTTRGFGSYPSQGDGSGNVKVYYSFSGPGGQSVKYDYETGAAPNVRVNLQETPDFASRQNQQFRPLFSRSSFSRPPQFPAAAQQQFSKPFSFDDDDFFADFQKKPSNFQKQPFSFSRGFSNANSRIPDPQSLFTPAEYKETPATQKQNEAYERFIRELYDDSLKRDNEGYYNEFDNSNNNQKSAFSSSSFQ